jgi:hypothetical protein
VTTTNPDPVAVDVATAAAALKVILLAIGVIDPPLAVVMGIIGAAASLAPMAEAEIAALLGNAKNPPTTPLEPQVAADTAALDQQLATPIAGPSGA